MKLAKLCTLSATALLISMGAAAAQGTGTMSSANADKCWDQATNQIKDKSTTGSAASSSSPNTGSTTSGTGSSMTGSSGTSGSTGTSPPTTAGARPAGMPNC